MKQEEHNERLDRLTPSERRVYDSLIRLQAVGIYRENAALLVVAATIDHLVSTLQTVYNIPKLGDL